MASVHVDAYFDYLLSRPNDYYQLPQRNPTDASDDESDVVLKLIKRAGSKRQKRKYTRKNTNTSNTSANDDGTTHPESVSRGDTTELDDDGHFESEDVDESTDKHRGKRVKASYSDDNEGSEEDRDPWAENEADDDEHERPVESTGTNQRRKSFVQVGFGPRWVKDNAEEEECENVVGGRLGEANPENDSSRYYRQYPSQFAFIEPKNGSNIPTPNPSPTTLPIMSLSSGNITGSKRVLSHSGTTGGAGTQKLRWRITTGPAHSVKSSADESYLTTSPSSSQKDSSKKKQDAGQVRDLKQPPQQMTRPSRNVTNIPIEQQFDGKNFAEMLLPSHLPNNDKETISILQKNLISAIGMLEDNQRKINMLNDIVRQREDDVRQRVVRALKNEVNTVIEKFQ
ncbi:hypothetical protein C1645_431900 [Glomus cerebriforme]|uniref:Uncharacterized protein n=1 Tax=Glomus cerebriforme TaxID=658196 RepID=A0A397SGQ3_9GLOM|nr:hypothetical protein C1645_431900 [Glomus cerebriforme]